MSALGGPRDYAEALWSFCRGTALPNWRVGRACEVKVTADTVRARLFFAPQIQGPMGAGTSNSAPPSSWAGPSEADPFSA